MKSQIITDLSEFFRSKRLEAGFTQVGLAKQMGSKDETIMKAT